jgi:hypothetical protein
VVDDRDVAGPQPLDQVLRPAAKPGGAVDRVSGRLLGASVKQGAESGAAGGGHALRLSEARRSRWAIGALRIGSRGRHAVARLGIRPGLLGGG